MPTLSECFALSVLGLIGGIVAYQDPKNSLLSLICVGIVGALKFSSQKDPKP